jgi:hypothetical protein
LTARETLAAAIGFEPTRWNRLQAENPGAHHDRFQFDEVFPPETLDLLKSTSKCLHAFAKSQRSGEVPPHPSPDEIAEGVTPALSLDAHKRDDPRHAPDFTWMILDDVTYDFSKGNQSETIRVLYEVWIRSGRRDGCGLGQGAIAEAIGCAGSLRIATLFHKHPFYKRHLCPTGKGKFAFFLRPK